MNKALLVCLLFLFAGCATTFVEKNAFRNGYSYQSRGAGMYSVTFTANEATPSEAVYQNALRKAAEVTLEKGYRYFTILKKVAPKRMGKSKEGLHYPSIRLYIQCFDERPSSFSFDAEEILSH